MPIFAANGLSLDLSKLNSSGTCTGGEPRDAESRSTVDINMYDVPVCFIRVYCRTLGLYIRQITIIVLAAVCDTCVRIIRYIRYYESVVCCMYS